jgi:glycosyltransferase involved in cell wall biosynthesis
MGTESFVNRSTAEPQPPAGRFAPSLVPPPDAGAASDAPSISVVIPAKNEGRNVEWVLQSMPRWVDEVILVDGNSTDHTVEVARRKWPGLVVVGQRRPGKGAALREGFASARGDIVVMIDADGSMDPGEIDRYVQPLIDGECDMVKGSRWLAGGGSLDITPFRKLGNKMLLKLVNRLFGSEFTELCYGFMAFSRQCVDKLELTADGFEIETQIVLKAVRAGMRVEEVASIEAPRRSGRSNLRPIRDGLRVLATVFAALFGGVSKRTEGGLGLDNGVSGKGGWPKSVRLDQFEWLE